MTNKTDFSSLIDRGVPVLLIPATWDEVGVGFLGKTSVGEESALDYPLSVVNGASLEAELENGELEEFKTASRFIHRVAAGFTYRPTPLVGFTLACEFTWTNDGKSLADVTNFLPARAREDHTHSLLAGTTFGFCPPLTLPLSPAMRERQRL